MLFIRPGAQFVLCLHTIYYLKRRPGPLTVFYIVFSLVLLLLNAIELAANTLYGQYMWIERGQTTPGGPAAYFYENATWWVNTLQTAVSLVADIMTQALLVRTICLIFDAGLNFSSYSDAILSWILIFG